MAILKMKSWSPYLVGAAIGVLSWFTFLTVDRPLGITTAFENSAELLLANFGVAEDSLQALTTNREHEPKIDWEWMLVLGVFLGAFLSSSASGDRDSQTVSGLWKNRFGPSKGVRLGSAFAGGALMMFGARVAQGCTSGHGISGVLQLAVSSIAFSFTFAVVAIVTARLMYGRSLSHV